MKGKLQQDKSKRWKPLSCSLVAGSRGCRKTYDHGGRSCDKCQVWLKKACLPIMSRIQRKNQQP